ncbi:DUF6922 domain-containing protein (plasmid) [Capnocytophaga canis]|uniref:DUF6922 domain-containing protein n=1 Tax=Capnocytophaga canis TaxID=1848903 RepID=UPI00370D0E91
MKPIESRKVSDFFPRRMFWEYNMDGLCLQKDKDFIIERVLNRSLLSELEQNIRLLENLYSREYVLALSLHCTEIYGNETIEIIANHYNVSPKKFYRYIS